MKLSQTQKLHALAYRFYQGAAWTPKAGDFYTTSRADLELYQVVSVEGGIVRTRYTEGSDAISEWPEAGFLTEGFGPKRVFVPEWVLNLRSAGSDHPDAIAVDRFADAMKFKLAQKRAEGREGWDDKNRCNAEFLSELLHEHVRKGDPLDVGILSMMHHQRGETIAPDGPESRVHWSARFSVGEMIALRDFLNGQHFDPPTRVSQLDSYALGIFEKAEAARLMSQVKFPQPNYVALKVAEEAGEVVRAAVHYAENRLTWEALEGEAVQTIAMVMRLLIEGDQVNGVIPPARDAQKEGAE